MGIIDALATFLLLSFNKLAYQSVGLLNCSRFAKANLTKAVLTDHIMQYNMEISCHQPLMIVTLVLVLIVCGFLPSLLIVLYPIKVFRMCLSKCRLDSLVVTAFVEKFHSCCRDGLDGGRDMRSFAGLYFFLRLCIFLYYPLFGHYPSWQQFYVMCCFLAAAVLIALARPYKHSYMNNMDILLLVYQAILSHLLSRDYFVGDGKQLLITTVIPGIVFSVIILIKLCIKTRNKLIQNCKHWNCNCWKFLAIKYAVHNEVTTHNVSNDSNQTQALLEPTSTVLNVDTKLQYGSIN